MDKGDDFLFDAGAGSSREPSKEPQTNDEVRAELEQIVNPIWTNRHGETYCVTRLDVLSSRVRATIRKTVEVLDPDAYTEYVRIRNEGLADGERPSLAQSRLAYKYLAQRFIELTYNITGS